MTQTPITPGRFSDEVSQIDVIPLGSRTTTGVTNIAAVNSRALLLQTQVANIGASVTVRLEGSLNGVNFFPLGNDTTYNANGFFALTFLEIPVPFVRANLVTINTGAPTVTFTLSEY
jgi:hypothetical protein